MYFDITMHIFEGVQVVDRFADILKVSFDFVFGELPVAKLDFFVETAGFCKLQYHVGDILILFVVVVKEMNNVGMVEHMMHIDLIFGISAMDLSQSICYHLYGHDLAGFSVLGKLNFSIGSKPHNTNFVIRPFDELVASFFHLLTYYQIYWRTALNTFSPHPV